MPDYEGFKVGAVLTVEDLTEKLKVTTIDVGASDPITVVTNAPNVEVGKRVVVATEGAVVGDVTIKPTTVGGKKSEGMLLDSPNLGWKGGAAGMAALVPDSFECGAEPPSSRPRLDGGGAPAAPEDDGKVEEGLFKMKPTKAEKKAAAAAKKAARIAKKEAAAAAAAATDE